MKAPYDTVTESADPMRFWVRSRSNPKIRHLVDLLAHGGAAQCSCRDWETRRWPAIRDGGETLTRETTCHHVRQAVAYFCRALFARMSRTENPPDHAPPA